MQEQLHFIDELLHKGDLKKADVIVAKQLRADISPEDRARFLMQRGRIRFRTARPEEAVADLQTALSLLPSLSDDVTFLELMGDCYFARFELASMGFSDRGDTNQAVQYYQHILEQFERYENRGWVYYQMGRICITSSQIEQAEYCLQQALLAPSPVPALTAFCYERLGFIAFYEMRDLEKALSFLNKAVDTYPQGESRSWLIQVHILRSRVLREKRDYPAALQAADTALNIATAGTEQRAALAEALLTVGELLTEIGGREREVVSRLQHFLQTARKPLGVDVTWSRVSEMLADAYFKLGQFDDAVMEYQNALQYNPDHPWEISILYRIARSYYQQSAFREAVKTIERLLSIARADQQTVSDYRIYDIWGNALFALKQYDKAVKAYQIALEIAPPNAENLSQIKVYFDYAKDLS